jgi:hypothetical protein
MRYEMTDNEKSKIPITHHTSDFENEIYQKLLEAQAEAHSDLRRLSYDEVFDPLRKKIASYIESSKNQG